MLIVGLVALIAGGYGLVSGEIVAPSRSYRVNTRTGEAVNVLSRAESPGLYWVFEALSLGAGAFLVWSFIQDANRQRDE